MYVNCYKLCSFRVNFFNNISFNFNRKYHSENVFGFKRKEKKVYKGMHKEKGTYDVSTLMVVLDLFNYLV